MGLKRPPLPKGVPWLPAKTTSDFSAPVTDSPPPPDLITPRTRLTKPPMPKGVPWIPAKTSSDLSTEVKDSAPTPGLKAVTAVFNNAMAAPVDANTLSGAAPQPGLSEQRFTLTPAIESQLDLVARKLPWMASSIGVARKALHGSGRLGNPDLFLKVLARTVRIASRT